MRKFLAVVLAVGVVAIAYSCGAGRGTPADAALTSSAWAAVVALAVGVGLGAAYARAVRAREDWVGSREVMRGRRRLTFSLSWLVTKWGVGAGLLAAFALYVVGRSG